MLIRELLEANPVNLDTEHYGIWTVEMSPRPVLMPAYTGNTRQYVAKATDKRTGKSYISAGQDQVSAREAAIAKGIEDTAGEISTDPADYDIFNIHFNVSFGREFHNPKASAYFKFMQEGGQTMLVRANREYVSAFGSELKELGFQHAVVRHEIKGEPLTAPVLSFNISHRRLADSGLSVGMRYRVRFANLDSDGNELFSIEPVSRVQTYRHKELLNFPSFTVNGIKLSSAK